MSTALAESIHAMQPLQTLTEAKHIILVTNKSLLEDSGLVKYLVRVSAWTTAQVAFAKHHTSIMLGGRTGPGCVQHHPCTFHSTPLDLQLAADNPRGTLTVVGCCCVWPACGHCPHLMLPMA